MVDQRRKSTRDVPRPTANVQGAPWTIRSQLAEKLNGRLGVRWSRRIRGDNVGILEPLCVVATVALGLGLHAEFLFLYGTRGLQHWTVSGQFSYRRCPRSELGSTPACRCPSLGEPTKRCLELSVTLGQGTSMCGMRLSNTVQVA